MSPSPTTPSPFLRSRRWLLPLLVMPLLVAYAPAARGAPTTQEEDATLRRAAKREFAEGKKRFALRQFRRALHHFSKAYELVPLSGFLFNIGQCHRFLGDCKKAVFFYSGFVRENPGTPDAAFVKKLIARCKVQQAQRRKERDKANTLYEEGRRAFTLQQYDTALAKFQAAYQVIPLPGYLYQLAETHRMRKAYAKAIHFYQAYLRQHPGSPRAKKVKALIAQSRRLLVEQHKRDVAAGRTTLDPRILHPGHTPRPVYKRWWFWTLLATGVAAAVGLGVGLGTRDDGSGLPDATHVAHW